MSNDLSIPQTLFNDRRPINVDFRSIVCMRRWRGFLATRGRFRVLPRFRTLVEQPRCDGQAIDVEMFADLVGHEERPVEIGDGREYEVCSKVP